MVRKRTKRGYLTVDNGVIPELKQTAQSCGWTVCDIGIYKNTTTSDETISQKFGKNKNILLTHDKLAHTHNQSSGFKGYMVYDIPSKKDFSVFKSNFKTIISTKTSTYFENNITYIDDKGNATKKKLMRSS